MPFIFVTSLFSVPFEIYFLKPFCRHCQHSLCYSFFTSRFRDRRYQTHQAHPYQCHPHFVQTQIKCDFNQKFSLYFSHTPYEHTIFECICICLDYMHI